MKEDTSTMKGWPAGAGTGTQNTNHTRTQHGDWDPSRSAGRRTLSSFLAERGICGGATGVVIPRGASRMSEHAADTCHESEESRVYC